MCNVHYSNWSGLACASKEMIIALTANIASSSRAFIISKEHCSILCYLLRFISVRENLLFVTNRSKILIYWIMFALYLNHGIVLLIRHYVIRHYVRIYIKRDWIKIHKRIIPKRDSAWLWQYILQAIAFRYAVIYFTAFLFITGKCYTTTMTHEVHNINSHYQYMYHFNYWISLFPSTGSKKASQHYNIYLQSVSYT